MNLPKGDSPALHAANVRHALPDVYPYNEPGYVESMITSPSTRHVIYQGPSPKSEWHLRDGTLLEIWPGGDVFNEDGTFMGRLNGF